MIKMEFHWGRCPTRAQWDDKVAELQTDNKQLRLSLDATIKRINEYEFEVMNLRAENIALKRRIKNSLIQQVTSDNDVYHTYDDILSYLRNQIAEYKNKLRELLDNSGGVLSDAEWKNARCLIKRIEAAKNQLLDCVDKQTKICKPKPTNTITIDNGYITKQQADAIRDIFGNDIYVDIQYRWRDDGIV